MKLYINTIKITQPAPLTPHALLIESTFDVKFYSKGINEIITRIIIKSKQNNSFFRNYTDALDNLLTKL
jgi:hypothetical protein